MLNELFYDNNFKNMYFFYSSVHTFKFQTSNKICIRVNEIQSIKITLLWLIIRYVHISESIKCRREHGAMFIFA